MWSRESFEGKYNIGFGIPIEFLCQRKKNIEIGNNEIMLELKMPKSSCLKWTYGRSSIDYIDGLINGYTGKLI